VEGMPKRLEAGEVVGSRCCLTRPQGLHRFLSEAPQTLFCARVTIVARLLLRSDWDRFAQVEYEKLASEDDGQDNAAEAGDTEAAAASLEAGPR